MILGQDTERRAADPPPPFLHEPTALVEAAEPGWWVRHLDGFDRWRPVLLLVVTPLVVAAIGLAYVTRPEEPPAGSAAAEVDEPSAIESLLDGVSTEALTEPVIPGDGRQPEPPGSDRHGDQFPIPDPPPISSTSTPAPQTTAVVADPTSSTALATTTTAPVTTASSSTTTTTTATTTTTTEPPDPCTVTVSSQASLVADPDDFGPPIGQVSPGEYPLLDVDTTRFFWFEITWYQLDSGSTVGWVDERFVSSTQGSCGEL